MVFHWRSSPNTPIDLPLGAAAATNIFISFAFAYFISYAFRSINAVIAPDLLSELHISNSDLGL